MVDVNDIDQIDLFFDSIQFDCRRMEDGHLIETFYITKPQLKQEMPQDLDQLSGSFKKTDEQAAGNTEDSDNHIKSLNTQKKIKLRDAHIQRSYRMISRQVNCSAAVSVSQKSRCTTGKKRPSQNNCQFMEQLEHFFRSFVPPQRKNEEVPERRRSSRPKSRGVLAQPQNTFFFETQSDGSGSEEETGVQFVRSQKQPHLTFYEKMREKIDQRIQPLLEKPAKAKLHKVETKPKSKKTVEAILKEKTNLRENQSHLRLSRAGLVIKLSQMQAKTAEGKLRMIETQKAKKDMIFQRCLIKNCEIVLENLQNYQRQCENPTKNRHKKQQHRRYNSNILHKTYSSQQKIHKDLSASVQDLSLLKLREKCLQIQLTCKENYKNNKQLKQGLRAFGKFCNRVQKRLQAGEDDIEANLRQNLQRDDEAQRLYDAMANIAPIQCYLRSLE